MPGEPRWPALAPFVESWTPAVACGSLWDTGLGYPAAVFVAGGGEIPGMRLAMIAGTAGSALERLDAIEGEGVLYDRVAIVTSRGPAFSYQWRGGTTGFTALRRGWQRRL